MDGESLRRILPTPEAKPLEIEKVAEGVIEPARDHAPRGRVKPVEDVSE